jgi:hypothetical protein
MRKMSSMQIFKRAALLAAALLISGCVSIGDINDRFRRLDRAWELEYQRDADELRFRIVEAPALIVYEEVRRTIIELGLPIVSESPSEGLLVAQNNAPTPLTKEEWLSVVKVEQPRVTEIGGWLFTMKEDSSAYVVTVAAVIRGRGDLSVVHLEYGLDMPEYRRLGITPTKRAPPAAVKIASQKFWTLLGEKLGQLKVTAPRRRRGDEFEI